MVGKGNAYVACIVTMLLLVSSIAGWSAPVRDGDPLTIGAILAQEDGSTATVTAEQIVSTGRSGKSFVIKEWFDKQTTPPRLVVISKQPLPVESGWTCDVTGVLSTVSGVSKDGKTIRQRVLITSPESVSIYMSPNGQRPIPFLPIKGFETNWASKISLADLAGTSMTASMSTMDGGELPPIPDGLESEPTPPAAGSRDSLKWLPDGAPVSLNGAIVSASFSDYGFFYVEKSDRSFGIWISSDAWVYDGQLVDITGRMGTGAGERAVIADQGGVNVLDYNTYPRPTELGMPNKYLGGGAVGLFTPAVADAAGLNNTGLLIRAWGKVTAVDSQYPIFWIDDGSAVAADDGKTGVKVYDVTYDPLPSVNDFVTLSGVSAAEWPEGSGSNIRVVWKTAPVARSTQPGSGTISGTITATGANGRTVKVYSASSSTTAVFAGNTANYTLNVPYGDHAVTASMLGYKTTTQFATVSSGTPVDLDFTLSTLQRRIDIVPLQKRIAPDGVSQTMVLAIVRDEEGRRLSGGTITWTTTDGSITPETSSVDDVGEAIATLTSSTDHTTSTVWAEMDGVSGGCYVEFANEGDPSIRITDPVGGQVSGFIPVRVDAYDVDSDGVLRMQLYVDGEPKGSILTNEYRLSGLDTSQLSNGWHVLTAKATDDNLNVMRSQEVYIYADNEVSQIDYSSEIFTDEAVPGNIVLSAQMNATGGWSVEIRNYKDNSLAYFTSGAGPGPIQATWDGKIGGSYTSGFYKVILSTESSGGQYTTQQSTTREYVITISQANASTLICGKLRGEDEWSRSASIDEMIAVMDACQARGITYTLVADPLWIEWGDDHYYPYAADPNQGDRLRYSFKAWINKGYHNFFYSTHGDTKYKNGKWRSTILFDSTNGQTYIYGTDYDWDIGHRPLIYAFSDLGIWPNQYRIVHINACWSGGNYLRGADETIPNAFGNYGAEEEEQVYLGWICPCCPATLPILQGLTPNGTGWTKEFYRQLGLGYTVSQAKFNATWYNPRYTGWMHNFLWTYGGDYVTWLTSW